MLFVTKSIFFCALFLFVNTSYAQFFDSIRVAFTNTPKIDFRIETRASFITTQPARVLGVKIGLDYSKKVKVGLGYNWLISDIERNVKVRNSDGERVKVSNKLVLQYFSPYFEYTYYTDDKWELSIPILLGFGTAYYERKSTSINRLLPINERGFLVMYEPSSVAIYKPVSWFGMGVGVGYRLVLIGNTKINENLNSPMYVIKLKLYTSELLRKLKH